MYLCNGIRVDCAGQAQDLQQCRSITQMNQNIENFIAITQDHSIPQSDIKKYFKWSKGDLQQALNYYYRRKQKEPFKQKQPSIKQELPIMRAASQPESVFIKMKQASVKQHRTQEFINQIRREYQLPVRGKIQKAGDKLERQIEDDEMDEQFMDSDYIPAIFNVSPQDAKEEMTFQRNKETFKQMRNQRNNKKEQFTSNISNQMTFKEEQIEQHKQIDQQALFEEQFKESQLFVGSYIIRAFSTDFRVVNCIQGEPIQLKSWIEQEKKSKKAGKGFSKKLQRNMNMRMVFEGRQLGRIQDDEVRIILPLITHKMIRVEAFALDVPKKLDRFTKITLTLRIYLLKKAITDPIVQTFSGKSQSIITIYQGLDQEITGLFDRLALDIKTLPLIKIKSKFSRKPLTSKQEAQQIKEEESKRKSELEIKNQEMDHRKLTDPFFKEKQVSLQSMFKLQKKESSMNQSTSIQSNSSSNQLPSRTIVLTAISQSKFTQLIDLYEQDLPPFTPAPSFLSVLYPYQQLALAWMLKREGFFQQAGNQQDEELHPLWTEYRLQEQSKYRLFLNELTKQISVKAPMAKIKCRGGILADQMGLGKTVMMAALMATHCLKKEPKMKKSKSQSKNMAQNLIVLPLTLLSQWQSELKKHTSLSVCQYYSSSRSSDLFKNFATILTTYGTISHQYSQGYHLTKQGIYSHKWHRIILDEAHYIKGRVIQTAKAVYELQGVNRWCLTGTPVQNNLSDLFSLIHFIGYSPWSEYECWNKFINKPQEQGDKDVHGVLRNILKRVMLRRTKTSKDSHGKPIIQLPPRQSKVQLLTLSAKQRQFYDNIYESSKLKIDELEKLGILQAKYMQVLQILLRLRQICDHPMLFKTVSKFIKEGDDNWEAQVRKFIRKREEQREGQKEGGHFEPLIQQDGQEKRIQICESKAITEIYLKSVLTKIQNQQFQPCLICLSPPEMPVLTSCLHIFCKVCAIRIIQQTATCCACRRRLTRADFIHLPRQSRFNLQLGGEGYFRSTKLQGLMRRINLMKPGDKAVVFSQFLGMMDLVQYELKQQSIRYVRMEGSTSHKERTAIVHSFQTDPSMIIFLVSLKTAGVGLNLTAANKVFLLDPWWNPGVEDQAIERVHRIGQTRQVQIIRFIVDRTIQMRMLQMNAGKKELSRKVVEGGDGDGKIEKLKYLMERY